MPSPRAFLGRDDRGNLGFDLGDGGPPLYLPPTADTAKKAMELELQAGRDPSLVLAPRRGAMAPDALAENASMPDGRKPSVMWDPPAPPARPRVVLDVAPGPAPAGPPAPPAPIPAGAPIVIESGPGETSAAKASGMSQPQIDARLKAQQATPAPAPAAPTTPGLSAGNPSNGLVATPQGGGAAAPAGPADVLANLNPVEREVYNLYGLKGLEELRKRASPGTLVKGGKVQTGESWQGIVGPNADTAEAQRANAAEQARLGKTQAGAYAERDAKQAEIATEQADYERQAGEIQAQIAARKQVALDGLGEQTRAIQQKIAAAEIDPDRWYAKKSTGERIGIGIALALDGIAKGLTRRVGGPNAILEQMAKLQADDIDIQIKNIDKARGDLNDLQRVYVQTREQFGDEALAADAAKLAGLAGFKQRIMQEAAKADAVMQTDPVFKREQLADMAEMETAMRVAVGGDTPLARQAAEARMQQLAAKTRSYSVKARLAELAVEKKMLDDQAALEERMNGALSKSFGFTQDRMVGGSGGPSLDKLIATKKAQGDLLRNADEAAAKKAAGKDEQRMLFVDGSPLPAAKGASAGSVDKAQDLITFADQGLDMVKSARERASQGGGMAPGDPRLKLAAAGIASVLSNAQGGGAPNDAVMETIRESLTVGPRQQAAIGELESQFVSAKKRAVQRVGAARLWPPSRCMTPRRGSPSWSTRRRPARSSARAARPSQPTRTCPSWAQTAKSGSSRAPTPAPSSRRLRASRRARPRGSSCASSSCKTNSAGSAGSSGRPWPAPLGGPARGSAMSP